MSVGLLIITHSFLGDELLKTAEGMLGICPLNVETLQVPADTNIEKATRQAREHIDILDGGQGVLVLTDMYGSTPSNIAHGLARKGQINIVAGVNLPMLIRVLNYPSLDLEDLTDKAVSGGRDGVLPCR